MALKFRLVLIGLLFCAAVAAFWGAADARMGGKARPAGSAQAIAGITPISGAFTAGAASGTVISPIGVTMNPTSPAFVGTLSGSLISVTGDSCANFAACFQYSSNTLPSNLETNGTRCVSGDCTYVVDIIATQSGASGSPFHHIVSIASNASHVVQTVSLLSTSGSDVAPSTPSPPMFALHFPSCTRDSSHCVASGQFPQLQAADGTPWPATYLNRSSWADGSIKHISVLPGPFPKTITTAGVQANVLNGGSAPAASGLTAAGIYAESIKLNVNGFDNSTGLGSGLGLIGNWSALLDNPGSDTNNVEQISYADGQGGRVWRFLTHVQQAGTPHGQMEVYWYVQQLLNASGGLAGYRVLPRLTEPWYNVSSPAADWRGLKDFNIQYGAGPTTITPPFQYVPAQVSWDNVPGDFTQFTTTAQNWFNGGSAAYSGGNLIYGYFTTTGTLPSGLSLNTAYAMATITSSNTKAYIRAGSAAVNFTITNGGTGIHTFNPIPLLQHFGTLWGAQSNGRPTYIQGAGTVAADAPIRVVYDNAALHATRVYPPFDMSLAPNSNPASFAGYTYSWDVSSIGPLFPTTGQFGERPDIGLLNTWQARHFYNQTATDELYVRMIGLAGAYLSDNVRDVTTRSPVRMDDPANTYTGLPASITNFIWDSKFNQATGFTVPVHGGSQFFNGNEPDHMPLMTPYAYLVTGEPQYLDLMTEIAAAIPGAGWCNNCGLGVHPNRNPNFLSTQYYGIVTYQSDNGPRKSAWGLRELVFAAGLYPDTDPYGTQIKNYLVHMRSQNIAFMNTWMANSSAYFTANGIWAFATGQVNQWQLGYMILVNALAATMAEDSGALTFLQSQSTYFNYMLSTFSGWQFRDYYKILYATGINAAPLADSGVPLTDDTLLASVMGQDNVIGVWAITATAGASPAFTWTLGNPDGATTGFVPTNGDKIVWPINDGGYFPNSQVPGGFSTATPYYAVNVSGLNFDLAATPGGTRIPVTSNMVSYAPQQTFGIIAKAPTSVGIGAGYVAPDSYISNFLGHMNYMIAAGVTGLSPVSSDTLTRFNSMLSTLGQTKDGYYKANPKYAVGASF